MTASMQPARCPCAGILHRSAEIGERPMLPDVGESPIQQIAEEKLLLSEKKVAGIHGPVGQNPQLRGPGRTAYVGKFGSTLLVRNET